MMRRCFAASVSCTEQECTQGVKVHCSNKNDNQSHWAQSFSREETGFLLETACLLLVSAWGARDVHVSAIRVGGSNVMIHDLASNS